MTAVLGRVLRAVAVFFELAEPEPTRLNCGCSDLAHRYVCGCGRTACEQHCNDQHMCNDAVPAARAEENRDAT